MVLRHIKYYALIWLDMAPGFNIQHGVKEMAWKEFDRSEIPENELVLVSSAFYGIHLRRFRGEDEYDDDDDFDDSEIDWDFWTEIPD